MSDGQAGNIENQVNGGGQGAVVQAGAISGGVHLHLSGEGLADTESPLIVTVDRSGQRDPYDEQTVLVDADPPEVMVREGSFRVTVESSLTGRAVILRGMRPVVLSRRPARRACHGLITIPTFRRMTPRHFSTDLNEATPQLRAEEADFPFSVSATDVEEFILAPAAGGDEILWHLEIDWLCAGRHGTTIVDDHGQPFTLYPRSGPASAATTTTLTTARPRSLPWSPLGAPCSSAVPRDRPTGGSSPTTAARSWTSPAPTTAGRGSITGSGSSTTRWS
ncbi:hypothetical protein [Streptomyces noursei]|uniref:hypothetical protein n=1 Tax=Streptomyces noursei TaxID=1971 RepID=UPI0019667224|nr:hypothetical protein [Streptomyces noursei]QRX89470.1 hypothetical protein JNO44_00090 [Streptomyces noursei]